MPIILSQACIISIIVAMLCTSHRPELKMHASESIGNESLVVQSGKTLCAEVLVPALASQHNTFGLGGRGRCK